MPACAASGNASQGFLETDQREDTDHRIAGLGASDRAGPGALRRTRGTDIQRVERPRLGYPCAQRNPSMALDNWRLSLK